ncbi:MAG: sigma-54-dependent Fis family transcriptional regulator [Deltaproteobacteria bacterium]|nr:sigma-54-dependent Fis family transcriptional regulator [Deltaproteobacteria bacterium]MBW1934582.1 sigma-54-dependent Fis family transcriptional regulator [Deltaproteobacteria bacterium]MBW1977704.1 sigma-54-dependent Fis family transcriptional regulator [Deltaproteobacteria bacterium]MBW2043418.1 sigma-54-dependent Fis family transcriptional regulator [Deltaproteobacteria bacterium]MBW2299462.1 sigma-54-dependent Fis family transcriptional regulator [Deltaproteobacteria bacterium]
METILIVDDEKNYLVVLEALLGPEGYEILTADNARSALRLIEDSDLDLVITDMKMPGMSGMELLEASKRIKPDLPVIMMTAYGTIEMAVEAMKKQAYDYVTKPFRNEELKLTVKKALENYRLIKENRLLTEALSERYRYGNIIGKSKPMLEIYELIKKVGPSKASVLITGPSGTGKELIARAIHYEDRARMERPFISVNCGALTETLLESELFGHEKGAFTGAVAMKKGRFELADKGTLFLDEVGEMPPSLQVKLLRVLQEMAFERVGGTKTIRVDVRVLSASNRNLKEDVAAGRFREDLYYRLNVIHVEVPPLRERKEDIRLLAKHFIEKYGEDEGKEKIELAPETWQALYSYSWPGNVRELENVIERAVVLSSGGPIQLKDLPPEFSNTPEELNVEGFIPPDAPLHPTLEIIEEKLIRRALKQCNNVQAHAAEMLGITKSLMQHKMKKYKLC